MKKYHKNICWKDDFDIQSLKLIKNRNIFTHHLIKHFYNKDRSHRIEYATFINILKNLYKRPQGFYYEIFEVEVENGIVQKSCFRTHYNNTEDIIIVFRYGLIVTAWLCDINDNHKTLKENNYEKTIDN